MSVVSDHGQMLGVILTVDTSTPLEPLSVGASSEDVPTGRRDETRYSGEQVDDECCGVKEVGVREGRSIDHSLHVSRCS